MIALRCSRLRCHRPEWSDAPACVHDISLDFAEARLHGITGSRGSGKTLLMHLLSLLDEPDFGTIELFGESVSPAPEDVRREIRNTVFGYIFPGACLLPAFTVAENIAMPLFRISRTDEHAAQERVAELLELLEIESLANEPAANLGVDSQFLVALARALVHRPRVLFLLDPGRPDVLVPHVRKVVDELHLTGLWCGPGAAWAMRCDHTVTLECGSVAAQSPVAR